VTTSNVLGLINIACMAVTSARFFAAENVRFADLLPTVVRATCVACEPAVLLV
jgi:hypothetical protein